MTDLFPMNDLAADDLLLDRLAARQGAGGEPVAVLLGALAAHADTPLPAHTTRRRTGRSHRYVGAFAALAVAASGAGVAAAVTLPDRGLSSADRARIEQKMEQSARSSAPSALLTRLGLPQTSGLTDERGLVLYRQPDGTIVLLPAAAVAAAAASGGFALAVGEDLAAPASSKGTASGGNAYGAAKGGQGGNSAGNTASGQQSGGSATGGSADPGNGDNQGPQATHTPPGSGDQGGTGKGKNAVPPAPTPTSSPTPTPTPTSTATADHYSTIAPPTGRVSGSPTPRTTTSARAPRPDADPSTTAPAPADPTTAGAGTSDSTGAGPSGAGPSGVGSSGYGATAACASGGASAAGACDPGTDASTSLGTVGATSRIS